MKNMIKWLTHQHHYEQVGFKQVENRDERYSMRKYKCQTCGKKKWVDGRFDFISK